MGQRSRNAGEVLDILGFHGPLDVTHSDNLASGHKKRDVDKTGRGH